MESFPIHQSAVQRPLLSSTVDLAWQTIHGRGLQLGVLAQPESSSRGYPTVRRLCSAAIGAATAGRGLLCPDADWAALLCHGQSHDGSRWELRGLRHAHRRHRHSDLLCNIHLAAPPHKRRSLPSHMAAAWRGTRAARALRTRIKSRRLGSVWYSSGSNLLPSASTSTSLGFPLASASDISDLS